MRERGKRWVDPEKNFVVHPDMNKALRNYYKNGKSLRDVFNERDKLAKKGETYHNTDHDEEMKETARNRTDNARVRGWKYPSKQKRA